MGSPLSLQRSVLREPVFSLRGRSLPRDEEKTRGAGSLPPAAPPLLHRRRRTVKRGEPDKDRCHNPLEANPMAMEGHILLVEGQRAAKTSCAPMLEEQGFCVDRVHTRRAAFEALEADPPDLLVVDTRHLRFNGLQLCESLIADDTSIPILLIVPEDQKRPRYPGVAVLRGTPTARKLLNRVKRLLSPPGNHLLRAGDLTLDLQRRVVIRGGEEHRLTPRQTRLLETFMRNPGRALTRAFLMKEVWKTDYLDDTRTLEVHVHWLRKVIEEDTRHPRYLTTVRKVGYCFKAPRSPVVRRQPDSSQEVRDRQTH